MGLPVGSHCGVLSAFNPSWVLHQQLLTGRITHPTTCTSIGTQRPHLSCQPRSPDQQTVLHDIVELFQRPERAFLWCKNVCCMPGSARPAPGRKFRKQNRAIGNQWPIGKLLRRRSHEVLKLWGASTNKQMITEMRMKWNNPCTVHWMNQWVMIQRVNESVDWRISKSANQEFIESQKQQTNETMWSNKSMSQWFNDSMNQWLSEQRNRCINEPMCDRSSESMNQRLNEAVNQRTRNWLTDWINE